MVYLVIIQKTGQLQVVIQGGQKEKANRHTPKTGRDHEQTGKQWENEHGSTTNNLATN